MPTPETPVPDQKKQVWERFENTREMALWAQFVPAVKKASHDTETVVTLPAGFLRIAEQDLENDPFIFSVLRRRWNLIIDELGIPGTFKKPVPEEAWARREEATDEQIEALHAQFEGSQEYRLWQAFVAALKGVSESSAQVADVPTGFLRIAVTDIEKYPFRFGVLRDAWNALVDEMDMPPNLKRSHDEQ